MDSHLLMTEAVDKEVDYAAIWNVKSDDCLYIQRAMSDKTKNNIFISLAAISFVFSLISSALLPSGPSSRFGYKLSEILIITFFLLGVIFSICALIKYGKKNVRK